ncbi:hypothetical protein C8R45DRAFT_1047372 [Mycena sanguinolenta]|nr:hypothetical protein C8R45DRAFT_1047372 [Mycena sanguinolenta]
MDTQDVNATLGALQIGVLISFVLFGVATTQCYVYFSRFPEDSSKVKALTAFVWLCEFANTACLGHILYTLTISDYAHPDRLSGPPPRSLSASTLFTGLTAASVQAFFAFRIYAFTKKIYIPALVWFMAFLHLVGRVILFSTTLHTSSLSTYVTRWEWLIATNWSISVASDVVITTTLVFVLHSRRSQAQRRTAALVDRIIVWTIETGMLTSATTSIMLACFVTMRQNYVWMAFYAISTQMFSNSLMTSLNSRASLRSIDGILMQDVSSSNRPLSNVVHVHTVRQVAYTEDPPCKLSAAV